MGVGQGSRAPDEQACTLQVPQQKQQARLGWGADGREQQAGPWEPEVCACCSSRRRTNPLAHTYHGTNTTHMRSVLHMRLRDQGKTSQPLGACAFHSCVHHGFCTLRNTLCSFDRPRRSQQGCMS
jgi:hypothetical protein